MPWREINPMHERVLFIADYLRETHNLSDLCRHYGISRKTGYKWIKRYQASGVDGLNERSCRPEHSPGRTPYRIRQEIIRLRQQYRTCPGAKKLRVLLARRFPNEPIPSKSTIYNILNQAGLVRARSRRRRVLPDRSPLAPATHVNELWSVDYKGQFKLGNGQWCYPLTVMDHQSRFLCGCTGLVGTRFKDTQRSFIQLFKEYGLPERIRSDNGVPFASTSRGGLSQLSIWWIRLGIKPERIQPGKPQQNGRHERMHRTLKQAATRPPSSTIQAQQRRFNAFRREYNQLRPHEAIQQKTPGSIYVPSPRAYPKTLPEMNYPDYYDVRKVAPSGVAYWRGKLVYVSNLLRGQLVGLNEIDDGIWEVFFGPVSLGQFDEHRIHSKTQAYISLKV